MSEDTVDDDQDEGGRPDEFPDAIAPGVFGFTFWRVDYDGNDIGTDVGFTWDGGTGGDWYQDISSKTEGLSVMSSSPVRGSLRWPDGKDVQVTYSATDFDIAGETVLRGSAPITEGGDKRDVAAWMQLAEELNSLVGSLLEG